MGRGRLPSPALVISVLALIVAIGGSSYAVALNMRRTRRVVVRISRKVANRRIRKLAPRLSVGHADSAGTAASAGRASTATSAAHADSAGTADSATQASHAISADSALRAASAGTAESAAVANHAYTAYHDGELTIHEGTYGTVGTLHVPQPGAYVILAKLYVTNHDAGVEYAVGNCQLVAPGAADLTEFSTSASGFTFEDATEAISLQVSPVLTEAADVIVKCRYESNPITTSGISVAWQKITAIQVAGRTTTGF